MGSTDDGMGVQIPLDPTVDSLEIEYQTRIFFSNELYILTNLVKQWGKSDNDFEKIAYAMKLLYNFEYSTITNAFNKLKHIVESRFNTETWYTEIHTKFFHFEKTARNPKGNFQSGNLFRSNGLPKNQYEGVCVCLEKITDPLTDNFVVFVPMPEQTYNYFELKQVNKSTDNVGESVRIEKRLEAIEQKINDFEQPSRGRSGSVKRKPETELISTLFAPPVSRSRTTSVNNGVSFRDAAYNERANAERIVNSSSRNFVEEDSKWSTVSQKKPKKKKNNIVVGNATVDLSTGFVSVGIVKKRAFKLTVNNQIDLETLKTIMKTVESPLKNYYSKMTIEKFRYNAFRLIIEDFPENLNPMTLSYWPNGMTVSSWNGPIQPIEDLLLKPTKNFHISPLSKDITDDAVKGMVLKAYQDEADCDDKIDKILIKVERREKVPAKQRSDEDQEKFKRRQFRRSQQSQFVVQVKFDISSVDFMIPNAILPYIEKNYPNRGVQVRTWKGRIPSEFKKKQEKGNGNDTSFLVF